MTWVKERKSTINPYNFIPLGEECRRKDVKERSGNLTGVIECKIIPKTDLFIPNTSYDNAFHTYKEEEEKKHLSYDFYSYSNLEIKEEQDKIKEPVIPGSEIRGMIKSEFEALTNSCIKIDDEQKLIRRTMQRRTPGVLIYQEQGWVLYQAKRLALSKEDAKNYKTGDIVKILQDNTFEEVKNNTTELFVENEKRGIVLIGEGMGDNKKKTEHVFVIKFEEMAASQEMIDKALENLELILESYRKENSDAYMNYNVPKIPSSNDKIPVWYYIRNDKERNLLYFSPAALGKDIYYNSLSQVIQNQTEQKEKSYLPCDEQEQLCDACYLFGTVQEKENAKFAVTSRIRFTDAHLIKKEGEKLNQYFRSPCSLKILSEPKVNCTEFYTYVEKQGEQINFWDYDWGNMDNIDISEDIKINGRKFYWHQKRADYKENERNNLNITARLLVGTHSDTVKKVPEFQFKLYFEKIESEELKKILWILSSGDNENQLYHKIGMGKPLGLGSIKIQVNDVKIRNLQMKDNTILYLENSTEEYKDYYTGNIERPIEDLFHLEQEQYIYDSYIKIMDFNGLGTEKMKKVAYPIGIDKKGNEEIFNWFIANKKTGKGARFYNRFPKILDKNIELPVYKELNKNNEKKK